MSLGILTNVAATYAQNNLNQTQGSLQNVLQQLSSGSRINSGADDAAGLSIADGLKANEAALTQSAQNAQNGVGLLQTADGALSQVTNLLVRATTLATEALNGGLTTAQTTAADTEYQSIITEIGNIGTATTFNGNQTGFTIDTRLIGPLTNLKDRYEQAGIYFGADQDNFVKLVAGRNNDHGRGIAEAVAIVEA